MKKTFGYKKSAALEYFRALQRVEFRRKYGWNLSGGSGELPQEKQLRINDILDTLGVPEDYSEIQEVLDDHWKLMGVLGYHVWSDMFECVCQEHHTLLAGAIVGFVPIGHINAFCLNCNDTGELLDGHIIGVNAGLFFCAELLAQAIVVENLMGDLASYRGSGQHAFEDALNLYLDPSIKTLNKRRVSIKNYPSTVRGEISVYVGALQAIILTFVALHELGHIVNRDLEQGRTNFIYSLTDGYSEKTNGTANWDLEFSADQFAIQSLCYRSPGVESAWNNFASIYMFFLWLNEVEQRMEKKSPDHPPALDRAEHLRTVMRDLLGRPQSNHTQWVQEKIVEWRT